MKQYRKSPVVFLLLAVFSASFAWNSRHSVYIGDDEPKTSSDTTKNRKERRTRTDAGISLDAFALNDPDAPKGFVPTIMKDLQAADPTSKLGIIAPPKANNAGTASLEYTLEMPPARNGMQQKRGE